MNEKEISLMQLKCTYFTIYDFRSNAGMAIGFFSFFPLASDFLYPLFKFSQFPMRYYILQTKLTLFHSIIGVAQ